MFPFTKLQRVIKRMRDLSQDTRGKFNNALIHNSYIDIRILNLSSLDQGVLEYLCTMYLEHRFDLLGSGWAKNDYFSKAHGLENYRYEHNLSILNFDLKGNWLCEIVHPKHLENSKKIWKNIKDSYSPIDWHKDIKSGFRWSAKKWYKDQRKKYYPGADLKMPWEISRFYHLPQLAVFALQFNDKRENLIKEFHNQIIDFIATNPPRMGINWTTTMEVAIRAVNMLIAYDIFQQVDKDSILDKPFHQIFSNSIYEHGKHIINNLEYRKKLTSNHYLSNITGLLFISSYLQENDETIRWFSFSVRELINELGKQFLPDGVNFESSTSYHMLSSQFVILSVSLIAALGKEKVLNQDVQDMILKIGMYAKCITKPTGEIPQIGDNDNGRLIKLTPVGEFIPIKDVKKKYLHLKHCDLNFSKYWDENVLNHTPLLACFDGLIQSQQFKEFGDLFPLEKSFICSLAKGYQLKSDLSSSIPKIPHFEAKQIFNFAHYQKTEFRPVLEVNTPLTQNLTTLFFPDSKIIVFKSDRLYLIINAMANGQNEHGGHAHNDKLSFELNFDGEDIVIDPGTYLYIALPERRNLFRSVKYHNTLVVEGEEQNRWEEGIPGLFKLYNDTACQIIEINKNKATLKLNYRKVKQVREFEITNDHVIIRDYSNKPFKAHFNKHYLYSNGYGKLVSFNL